MPAVLHFNSLPEPLTLAVIDVAPDGGGDLSTAPAYKIVAAFKNAGLVKRFKLYVSSKSQDARNMAAYYKNRLTLPHRLRTRYGVLLKPGEEIDLLQPTGRPMPEHDAHLLALRIY